MSDHFKSNINQSNLVFSKAKFQSISEAVQHFDKLSPECHVRLPVVKTVLAISGATVWRLVQSKKLKAYKLTARTTSFNVGEIRKFLAGKAEA